MPASREVAKRVICQHARGTQIQQEAEPDESEGKRAADGEEEGGEEGTRSVTEQSIESSFQLQGMPLQSSSTFMEIFVNFKQSIDAKLLLLEQAAQ